jgi:hypothetical protein
MTNENLERLPIVLATTMGTEQWTIPMPVDIPVQAIILKLLQTPGLPFRAQDDGGEAIPYRLMWKEGNRYLGESETLRVAQVEQDHTLIMTHEARAGSSGTVAPDPGLQTSVLRAPPAVP